MTTKQVVPEGMKVGTWSGGAFTPIYKVNNGRMELPDRAGHPALPLFNGRVLIANGAALDIDFGGPAYGGWATFVGGTFGSPGGMIGFRAGGSSPTPWAQKWCEANPFTILNNTALTGDSGAGGEVTVSTTDGHLFIENQLGNDRYWHITVFGVAY